MHGKLTAEKASQSSTWRELTAELRVLKAVFEKLSYTRVHWFSDNQNVVRILYVGSRKAHSQAVLLKIFSLSARSLVKKEAE